MSTCPMAPVGEALEQGTPASRDGDRSHAKHAEWSSGNKRCPRPQAAAMDFRPSASRKSTAREGRANDMAPLRAGCGLSLQRSLQAWPQDMCLPPQSSPHVAWPCPIPPRKYGCAHRETLATRVVPAAACHIAPLGDCSGHRLLHAHTRGNPCEPTSQRGPHPAHVPRIHRGPL